MSTCGRSTYVMPDSQAVLVIQAVLSFLEFFLPITFAKRLVAAVLLAANIPVKMIAESLDMGKSTIYGLRKSLQTDSIEELQALFRMKPGCGRKLKAIDIFEDIAEKINQGFYTSLREIQAMIKNTYGIALSIATTQRLMIKLGIKRYKSASLPAKAIPSAQEEYYNNTLLPLIQQAKSGALHLLFLDGSHFVVGCDFLGFVYGCARRFVKSLSGRQRYNVLGAMDFVTKKVHTVTNSTYITATEVIEMMGKLVDYYRDSGKPIRIILDNARYQKCAAVQCALEEYQRICDIDFKYLPSYSPNLNLIERVWRFVKGEIRSSFIKDFSSFCDNIDKVIASTTGSCKERIDTLIGEDIQFYTSLIPVDAHSFVMPKKKKAN